MIRVRHLSVAFLLASFGATFSACAASQETGTTDPPDEPDPGPHSRPIPIDSGSADTSNASDAAIPAVDKLAQNRDRLLATYLAYLKANPAAQTNGLAGPSLTGTCDLWKKLAPSPQSTFLTLTARMQGSIVATDGKSMLAHVAKLYRVVGGDGATASDPGSCGGGENNRAILSMDAVLQASLLSASSHQGGAGSLGKPDITDQPSGTVWRQSKDIGGAHAPFDLSDETESGAPRAQVQFFKDPTSTKAKSALGRTDLKSLVDPLALEIDQDYDCPHNSNPLCTYTLYGSFCLPGDAKIGTDVYKATYGDFDEKWEPADCPQ